MKKQLSRDLENVNTKKYEEDSPPRNVEATFLPDDETPEDHDMTELQEPPIMEISRKRKPAWAREIIQRSRKIWSSRRLRKDKQEAQAFF